MTISFQNYKISIYIKIHVVFETQLMETTKIQSLVSKTLSHNI